MAKYRQLLDILTEGRELPDGCDRWGFRACKPDGSSFCGFVWPQPGDWAEAPGPFDKDNLTPCPALMGDGICVAFTPFGAASSCLSLAPGIWLVAFNSDDVLGEDKHKARVKKALVVDVVSLRDLDLRNADLSGARLSGAYLSGARLSGAYLSGARLSGAYLCGAFLDGAYLCGAFLDGARWNEHTRWPHGFTPPANSTKPQPTTTTGAI